MSLIVFKVDRGDIFKSFLSNRNLLISMLEKKEISKKEFLDNNMRLLYQVSITPKTPISSIEEGVFSYQYYNGYAKYNQSILQDLKVNNSASRKILETKNKVENFYREKDKATLSLLEFVDYKGVEAYHIFLNSKRLEGVLFEINFKDYERIILHSKSRKIKRELRDRGLLEEGLKNSAICDYVNTEY